jgi:Protein of unknown function (DUF1353)
MTTITVVSGSYRYLTLEERLEYPEFKYVTTSESRYIDESGKTVVVPVGFLTDGCSGGPDYGRSWLIHDYLYSTHQFTTGEECTRREADKIMEKILSHEGLMLYRLSFFIVINVNPCCVFSNAWNSSGDRGVIFLEE